MGIYSEEKIKREKEEWMWKRADSVDSDCIPKLGAEPEKAVIPTVSQKVCIFIMF